MESLFLRQMKDWKNMVSREVPNSTFSRQMQEWRNIGMCAMIEIKITDYNTQHPQSKRYANRRPIDLANPNEVILLPEEEEQLIPANLFD